MTKISMKTREFRDYRLVFNEDGECAYINKLYDTMRYLSFSSSCDLHNSLIVSASDHNALWLVLTSCMPACNIVRNV